MFLCSTNGTVSLPRPGSLRVARAAAVKHGRRPPAKPARSVLDGGERRTTRGGQPYYSALAITTALTLRAVFRLALRQTEGLIGSIIRLLGLDLAVPDHSTLSRRAETLQVLRPRSSSEPVHLLVDSTGLRLCGPGEWLVEKHGTRTRRSWRKLHLGVDADTGEIVAAELTSNDVDDGSQVGPLLDQVARPVASFTGDGAFDRDDVYGEVAGVTLTRRSSCRRDRVRCRARRRRPRRRSVTSICSSLPSGAAWVGRRRLAITGVRWWRPISAATSG